MAWGLVSCAIGRDAPKASRWRRRGAAVGVRCSANMANGHAAGCLVTCSGCTRCWRAGWCARAIWCLTTDAARATAETLRFVEMSVRHYQYAGTTSDRKVYAPDFEGIT